MPVRGFALYRMNQPSIPRGDARLIPSGRQGRRPLEAHRRVSRSAERDLRNFLKKVPACLQAVNHSKTFPLLLSKESKIFEQSEKINLSFCRRQIIILISERLWLFSVGKRRCSAAETESTFAEGKYADSANKTSGLSKDNPEYLFIPCVRVR